MERSKIERLTKERQRRQRIVRDMAMDPVDRSARIVTGSGVSFKPLFKDDGRIQLSERVLMRAVKYRPDNLRHRKFGKFVVLGLTVEYPGRWLVQCQCGVYELRRAKAIKNPLNAKDACASCKQEAKYLTQGRELCFVGSVN